MGKPMCRAKCGAYVRDWKIQVKRRWFGWRTIHSGFMEPAEAQAMLDRLAKNNGSWEVLYPSENRLFAGAVEHSEAGR